MKISAPSRSEETVTVPTPSGADDEEIFDDSEDSVPSLARGWPAVSSGLLTRGGGEFFGERHGVGIEAMENLEKIRSAEGDEADAFRDAEEHGVARIAEGQNVFALADAGGVGKGEMRKVTFAGGAFDFGEGDVEIGIDVNDFGFELLAVGEDKTIRKSP